MVTVQDVASAITTSSAANNAQEVRTSMERLTYTVSEVAQVLGISRSKAYTLVAEGAIAIVPLPGRRKLVARTTLDQLLGTPTTIDQPITTTNQLNTTTDDRPTESEATTPSPRTRHERTTPTQDTQLPIPTHTVAPGVRGSERRPPQSLH
jgi:excisionase family DNA binding protein